MTRRPIALRHQGVVRSDATWFVDGPNARRRVLDAWDRGHELRALEGGWLLRRPSPVAVDTRRSWGTVLVDQDGRLVSAPLPPAELAAVPRGSVVLLLGGRWIARDLRGSAIVDPSTWWSLEGPRWVPVAPLGDPPAPPALAAAPVVLDLRSRLGLPSSAGIVELSTALARPTTPTALQAASASLRRRLAVGLGAAASWWSGRLGPAQDGAGPTTPGLGRRVLDGLERWSERLGLGAALEAVVGEHNSRYLQGLLDLFDEGRWLEAVERAVPLGGSAAVDGAAGGGLAWLSAIGGFRFRGAGGGSVPSAKGDPTLYDHLKRLYRRAFQELDATGRTREAAYVLAELLGESAEAATYLEEHQEWAAAAELAEARGMDPGLVVLLWLRAGERERALALAVVNDAWAAAVAGLERRGDTDGARSLRVTWAEREGRAGRAGAAVGILWADPELRALAEPWYDLAIEAGGVSGARTLAASLSARPERAETDLVRLRTLVADRGPEGPAVRRALASALGDSEVHRRALRAVARGLLVDASPRGTGGVPRRLGVAAEDAARRCGDGALLTDLPAFGLVDEAVWAPGAVVRSVVREADAGTLPILDAVLLPRGRLLVALGELGAAILAPDGRRLVNFATPTHALVPAFGGQSAVLVARRPGRLVLSRLDPHRRAVTPWAEGTFGVFADCSDGLLWFVAEGDRLFALDLQADGLRASWSVTRPTGHADDEVLVIDVDPKGVALVTRAGGRDVEAFRYDRAPLRLVSRRTVTPTGPVLAAREPLWADAAGVVAPGGTIPLPGVRAATSLGRWCAAATRDSALLVEQGTGRRAELGFEGAGRVAVRLMPPPDEDDGTPWLIAFDDRGRVRVLDPRTGTVVLDHRL